MVYGIVTASSGKGTDVFCITRLNHLMNRLFAIGDHIN